ncbi:hypothetical protein QFZ69_003684 [Arthrobacter sp. V1I7]|nr:hypothetical protein [Arthrobacter sp. V1I7]MDQ0822805.1 hypothetical protein [Arthrobacter sp. V1I7]
MTKAAYTAALTTLSVDYQVAAQRFVDDQAKEYAYEQTLRPTLDRALSAKRTDLDATDAAYKKAVAALTKANSRKRPALDKALESERRPMHRRPQRTRKP